MTHLYAYDISGNATLLDIYLNESISLNFRFTDVATFGVQGSFTRQFRIPASPANVDYFGSMFDPNATDFDFRKKAEAYLAVDTIPISNGHIQLLKTYTRGGEAHEFEITFYAETPDLSRAVGDAKLADIAALTTLDHEVNYTEVTAAPADRGFFLLDRGQRWSEEGEPGTKPVQNPDVPLYAADLSPAVSAAYLFNNIISEAGFDWEGWNGSTVLLDALESYYVPFVVDRFIKHDGEPQDEIFELGLPSTVTGISSTLYQPSFTEVYDNGSNVASSVWTAPYTGFFQFRMWAKLERTTIGSTENFRLQLTRNGSLLASQGVVQFSFNQSVRQTQYTTAQLFLTAGDTIQMRIEQYFSSFTYELRGSATYDPAEGTGWSLIGASPAFAGQDIIYSKNAPDYKQIDFVKDIIKAHNCVVVPDRNIPKKLYIEPLGSFIGSGSTIDWTQKLDLSKDVVIGPTTDYQSKTLLFTYKAGSDFASQFYQKDGGRVYGDYKIDGYTTSPTDTPSDFAQGENKVELGIASTPCYEINGTNIIIPKFISDGGAFQLPGVRMLFNAGTASVQLYDDVTANDAVETSVYLLNHYSTVFPDLSDSDLNFAPEDPLYIGPVQVYNNLFNTYFRNALNEIYDRSARVMVAYFTLDIADITSFTFADKLWIKDSYWRILEIAGYNVGMDDPTQVTLIKIVNPVLDCQFIPDTISLGGVVTFLDQDGDPSSGSQECCERFGYEWQDDRCYAFIQSIAPPSLANQGTEGVGNATNSPTAPAVGNFNLSSGSNIAADTNFSLILGGGHIVQEGNAGNIIAGDTNALVGAQAGSVLIGKNAIAQWPGMHLGGAWQDGDRSGAQGRAQYGVIVFQGHGDFTNDTTEIPVYIDGVSGKHLELFDLSVWSVTALLTIQKGETSVTGLETGVYAFRLSKDGAISKSSTPDEISRSGTLGTPTINIDTSTDSDEHRISISIGGATHPHNDCFITLVLQYAQVSTDFYLS
jgi:hypothetical protein